MTFDRYMISSKVNINITDDLTAKVTLMGRIEEGTNQEGLEMGMMIFSVQFILLQVMHIL